MLLSESFDQYSQSSRQELYFLIRLLSILLLLLLMQSLLINGILEIGGTSVLPNPTYTYITQGTYDVRLIITTSTGCNDTLTVMQAVKVGSKPVADFSTTPIPVCGTQPVQFTDLSVPADEWDWDFGDGEFLYCKTPHTATQIPVTLISVLLPITMDAETPLPKQTTFMCHNCPFNIVPDCNNRLRFTFTDQSIAPLSWDWDFGDGGTSIVQSPSHIYPALGTYSQCG